jgi:large subunit ribosomal protein L25
MRHHQGQSVVFHLNILEGETKLRDYPVILKDEHHDPVKDDLLHIDFQRISLDEEIEVNVPLETVGDPLGVKKGGSLDHTMWELDVVCLPTNIPGKIKVDVSHLEIGDVVHVKEIVLPQGVKTNHDPEAIVASVVPPMKEEITTAETAQGVEPEVIKDKAKKEEQSEEESSAEKK